MTTVLLAPTFGAGYQGFTSGGLPLNAGLIYTYSSGSTTPQATYTTSVGNVQNANPVVLSADGRPPNEIWMIANAAYRFDLKDSDGNLIQTYDNLSGMVGGADLSNTANVALGDALVGFRQSNSGGNLSGSVGTTVHVKFQDLITIRADFNAAGNGSTDDTAAFSSAITSNNDVILPRATYAVGVISTATPPRLTGSGTLSISGATGGIELAASMTGVRLNNIIATGDAVVLNNNRLLWNSQAYTISNVKINGISISSCVQNLDLGTITDIAVSGSTISSAAGTAAGQGYGIVMGSAKRVRVYGNYLTANGRVGLYQSDVEYFADSANVFYAHANASAGNASLVISRDAKGGVVSGSVFAESLGAAVYVDSDNTSTRILRNVLITGNVFHKNVGADVVIGAGTPAAAVNVQAVMVKNNAFSPTATRINGFITVVSGFTIDISSNHFDAKDGTATTRVGVSLAPSVDTTSWDRINISNNSGDMSSSGGDARFINIAAALCTGTTEITMYGNNVKCDTLIFYATDPPTNPNIKTDSEYEKAVTLVVGAQAYSIAGYNNFVLTGNAGASSISNFTNGYEGKIIRIRFVDALVTLTASASLRLAGGANFVSSNYDTIALKYNVAGTFWYELDRSVNA